MAIETLSYLTQLRLNVISNFDHNPFLNHASRDSRLICDHYNCIANSAQHPDCFDTPWIHTKSFEAINVTYVFNECSVSI